jgi:putative flippase GtrA
MRLTSLLPERVRHLGPEVLAFGIIGAANSLLYFAITVAATHMNAAVKGTIVGTLVTTVLAYLANRHWTYRHHSRSRRRREYTLFFGFNMIGMIIQSGSMFIAKYGFGITEANDKLAVYAVMVLGTAVATVFRFWAYRTFVFLKPKPDTDMALLDATAALAEVSVELHDEAELLHEVELLHEAELRHEAEVRNGRVVRPAAPRFSDLDAELVVEVESQRHARR